MERTFSRSMEQGSSVMIQDASASPTSSSSPPTCRKQHGRMSVMDVWRVGESIAIRNLNWLEDLLITKWTK
jgi:hypothetical protein